MTITVVEALRKRLKQDQIRLNEPMKAHTTFKAGGSADVFVLPRSRSELAFVMGECARAGADCFVLGRGSNVLVRDGGIRGIVIATESLNGLSLSGDTLIAGAGATLAAAADFALGRGLTGLEFASGIPGSVGGAVFMNAGAYDGEMKDIFLSAVAVTPQGTLKTIARENMGFGYRHSIAQDENLVIAEATLALDRGDPVAIRLRMEDLRRRRDEKQPMDMPSAGSTFKRPAGHFAGKLIMDSGLRGYAIGGAQVSPKHCGFIINRGDATAADILELIGHVRETVFSRFGILLEPEVRIIGEDVRKAGGDGECAALS